MSQKISILFCTDGIFPHAVGGMQRHSRLLIEELAKDESFNIIAVHPHTERIFSGINNITEIQVAGIDTGKNYLRQCYLYSKRVFEITQQYPLAVIYAQGLSVWYGARKVKHRLINNPHGLEPFQSIGFKAKLLSIPFKAVFRKIWKQSSYVISLGGYLTKMLQKNGANVTVIPNGVKAVSTTVKPANTSVTNVLFVGRFASNKGIHILMQAIDILNTSGYKNKFMFYLVGTGPLYQKYKNANLAENVRLEGFVADDKLGSFYEKAHVFVLPTLFEGMPTVVLEAMVHGLPVIVSDVGATAELVNEQNGFLIPRNNVNELVAAFRKFDKLTADERKKMSIRAQRLAAERFSWQRVAEMHKQVFQKLANDNLMNK